MPRVYCLQTLVLLLANMCFAQFGPRIIGGERAIYGQFPFYAHIRVDYGTGVGLCGGSLISPYIVLTAAHCCLCASSDTEFQISLNSYSQSASSNFSVAVDQCTEQFTTTHKQCHPDYADDDMNMANDFCFLTLPTPSAYSPISVYDSTKLKLNPRPDKENTDVSVIGFGSTSPFGPGSGTLQKVVVPIANTATCLESWGSYLMVPDVMICSNTTMGRDTCHRDSGSPMFTKLSNGNFLLIGIASFGAHDCNEPFPSVFARVDSVAFRKWASPMTKPTRVAPTIKPPTSKPTRLPTLAPTVRSTRAPSTKNPTNPPGTPKSPTARPTKAPTTRPTQRPSRSPVAKIQPSQRPSQPTFQPTCVVNQYP